jgi:hypothetical protein
VGGRGEAGQVAVGLVGGLAAVLVGVVVLGLVARGAGAQDAAQRAADLAALAGARAMHAAYPRLFEPAVIDGLANPAHLEKASYLELGERTAVRVAAANGAPAAAVRFPDGHTFAPVRVRVEVRDRVELAGRSVRLRAMAEAELGPGGGAVTFRDGYDGPLATRQGKPMRPDVALAFDRMAAAAQADGVALIISSAYRSDAEQAVLWAQRPDPRWVAPPGTSLHRNGTELDLGPPAAYPWLAANARRFRFIQRYEHELWHYGFR